MTLQSNWVESLKQKEYNMYNKGAFNAHAVMCDIKTNSVHMNSFNNSDWRYDNVKSNS